MKCRTEETVDLVSDLVVSQEYTQQTYRMVCEISLEAGVQLRFFEITSMSLLPAFYWNTV